MIIQNDIGLFLIAVKALVLQKLLNQKMNDSFPNLETARILLVELKRDHLDDIFKLYSDPRIEELYDVATMRDKNEALRYIEKFRLRYAERTGIRWGIIIKGVPGVAGTIGLNHIMKRHKASLGYDLRSDFWNKGYITEVINAIVEFGFTGLGLNRIEAEVMAGNCASEKVLIKTGFQKEGVQRQCMYWHEKYYDLTKFSILQSDPRPARQ